MNALAKASAALSLSIMSLGTASALPSGAIVTASTAVRAKPAQNAPMRKAEAGSVNAEPAGNARQQVLIANEAARIQPARTEFMNAMQVFSWSEGALFQVYASPGRITDIMLQPGERLSGTGPVAAGDTVRWIIGDTVSGSASGERVHVLIKPTRPDITTNLVINTDRRTYNLELRATPSTYMASVGWIYPQDELIAIARQATAAEAAKPVADGIEPADLFFDYRLSGDRPRWRPIRVFDDGRQAYVEFPEAIARDVMPPFFILGNAGAVELVNYRVQGRFMVIDRLFEKAELRLGDKRSQQSVRIVRAGSASK